MTKLTGPNLASKKELMLEDIRSGMTNNELCHKYNISQNTFYSIRRRDFEFDKAIKEVKQLITGPGKRSTRGTGTFDPDREIPAKGTFAEWRMKYLGRPTHPLHQAIADAMLDTTTRITFVFAPPSPQPADTPVLTTDGWKLIGEITTEDRVYGWDGTPKRVSKVTNVGPQPTARFHLDDGTTVDSALSHVWTVRDRNAHDRKSWRQATTGDILAAGAAQPDGRYRWSLPISEPIHLEKADLPLDPYVMGVLLGDGSFRQNSTKFTTADPDLALEVARRTPEFKVRKFAPIQYRITDHEPALGVKKSNMRQILERYDLWGKYAQEKHIPSEYLNGSIEQRLDLLRGLMDSDGHISQRSDMRFTSTSPALIAGVSSLVRSLGGIAKQLTVDEREGKRTCFSIGIIMPPKLCPFLLERKAARFGRRTRAARRKIAAITLEGTVECVCLTVEDSHYVTENWVLTHNSGKDTTVGDALLYMKCDDREYLRTAWVMENENFSSRRLSERLAPYLTDPAVYRLAPHDTPGAAEPTGNLIEDFGPFQWERGMRYPDGSMVARTTWTKHEMRFLQSAAAPEADPDLWATGMGGAMYGARVRLFVYSDLFTRENQNSPTEKEHQFEWCVGTADSRMDATGRLVVLGTRVAFDDNYGRLVKHYIGDAEVYESRQDGAISTVYYTNGVAVITCQAIFHDQNGDEQSYWPQRFPLDDRWKTPTGEFLDRDALSISQARKQGCSRVQGLRSIRAAQPVWFESAYQQNPSEESALSDFTDATLDYAMAPHRTYGRVEPRELKIISVDPARVGGAAWVLLAVDLETETITLADYRFLTNLGIQGIKRQLIVGPLQLYDPAFLSYETNHEQAVLYDPEIVQTISDFGVQVHRHHTGTNRADRTIGPASLAGPMRRRQLVFPTMTANDKARTLTVRQHFKNWDSKPQDHRTTRHRSAAPDDLAMACWPGVMLALDLIERHKRTGRNPAPKRPTPESIKRRWASRRPHQPPKREKRVNEWDNLDLLKLYMGNDG